MFNFEPYFSGFCSDVKFDDWTCVSAFFTISSKEWATLSKSEKEKLQHQSAEDGEFW